MTNTPPPTFPPVVGAVPGGWGEMKNLTAKAGDKVTLPTGLTGLDGEYILWYFGSNKTRLIHCDEGNMSKENESLDLDLDKATGSLTIFSIKYGGVYTAEIFDRNNMKHICTFNVTVLGDSKSQSVETKNLTGKAGESITLNTGVTGLRGNYQVLWSYGVDQRVIINFDNGKLEWNESQRFQLDERTGSLTILSLHINDSGQYQGQIINGNGSQQTFNLTVVGECLEACGEANPKNVCVCMELHAEKLETDSIKRTFADSCELFKITSNVVLLRLVHFERYKAAGRGVMENINNFCLHGENSWFVSLGSNSIHQDKSIIFTKEKWFNIL
uniref:Immunoglobulin domain-containing protein n=1 Tax=Monopterus albus TaxID=43700 RepID=A0A3Q3ILK9_MONAL